MARSRNIKPGFFTNDVLGELPPLARLLFAGLWTICDREGRCEDRPKKIKAEVLPYDNCDADELLTMLEASGFIARYFAQGQRVIQVLTWDKHQNPHVKEGKSTLPALDMSGASTVQVPDKEQPSPERAGLIPDSGFLIPDSSTSVANATDAPSASELTRAELWAAGKSLLSEQGMPVKQCGTFVGKLVKDYGEVVVVEAVRTAVVMRPADAASYLKATCQARASPRMPTESFRERDRKDSEAKVAFLTGKKPQQTTLVEVIDVTPRTLGREDLPEAVSDVRPSLPSPI